MADKAHNMTDIKLEEMESVLLCSSFGTPFGQFYAGHTLKGGDIYGKKNHQDHA